MSAYVPKGYRSRSPSIEAMRAETRPGRCIGCDKKLPVGKRCLCGSVACLRLYQKLWKADHYALQKNQRYLEEFGRFARGEIP